MRESGLKSLYAIHYYSTTRVFLHAREWIEIVPLRAVVAPVYVFLHAREWIEITSSLLYCNVLSVFLHAREWIEISLKNDKTLTREVFLHAREWIEMQIPAEIYAVQPRLSPCERVDWNTRLIVLPCPWRPSFSMRESGLKYCRWNGTRINHILYTGERIKNSFPVLYRSF